MNFRVLVASGRTKKLFLLAFLLLTLPSFAKRKDDVVVMNNGDSFTGEIKSLEYGELIFKSDYMKDSVHLDWKRVKSIQSKDAYIVSLADGQELKGLIQRQSPLDEANTDFQITAEESTMKVSSTDVIRIAQSERSFFNQLTGSVNYGFSFSSGNSSTTSSLGADVAFRTANNMVSLATTSQFDTQAHTENTNRFTFDSEYARNISQDWLAVGLFSLLKSNQQNLQLRSTYGGGIGRRLVRTDRTNLLVIGGAAYTHESYVPQPDTEPIRNNAESLFGLTFNTFRFKTLNINSQNFVFPSLSDPGRVRFTSQSNLRIELVRNFYWNFQLYENYDTKPPVNAPKNDLGLTTSVGWTF